MTFNYNLRLQWLLIVVLLGTPSMIFAQTGIIQGKVFDPINNEAIPFANVVIQGTTTGTTTDIDGRYEITNLKPDLYNIEASFVGYKSKVVYEIQVFNSKPAEIDIPLEPATEELDEVVVKADPFVQKEESPLSLQSIGVNEIQRNPGGNRDISKAIQSLPGVASSVSFRNDIIIRGGGPNENRFYIDGIEVPNINHFATQGSTGGPVGLLNVNFIKNVDFYTGAFPANRGNALSSVMEIQQREGRTDRLGFNFTLGSSDAGLTAEGPLGKKGTFIASFRRSYLQLLFEALELPFLPTYNDFQFKTKFQLNENNQLTVIGLGAIDNAVLNLSANETEDQKFLLGNLPEQDQWSYTVGANYKNFRKNGYTTLVISRNHLSNSSIKYQDNIEVADGLILDYVSEEIENKLRLENTNRMNGWKLNYGLGFETAQYTNSTFNRVEVNGEVQIVDYDSELNFNKYSLFAQASKTLLKDKLTASLGFRMDANSYSDDMNNPLEQFSPRLSLSYALSPKFSLNFNTGIFYQLPAYTVLGYRDNTGNLVNADNGVRYIQNTHLVGGVSYQTDQNSKFSVEGFYKKYNDYPFLLRDSISLANLGADFGVIGDAPVSPDSQGKAFGLEFLFQQKLFKGFYGIAAYTFVRSEFTNKNPTDYAPASWDNRHLVSMTAGKKFKKNWELGLRWRYIGGTPYTPYDVATSSLQSVWDVSNTGIFDFNRINTERLPAYHQLDVRLDKKWFYNKFALNLYLDIENIYSYSIEGIPNLTVQTDENDVPLVDPNDSSRYQTKFIQNELGNLLPSIGVVVEW
ncbi:MAG: TonB-dependent receptor [Chitinophagales bacterium]